MSQVLCSSEAFISIMKNLESHKHRAHEEVGLVTWNRTEINQCARYRNLHTTEEQVEEAAASGRAV